MTDFHIRPATEADLEAVARIHTYYIENTAISFTTKPRAHAEYLEKFRDITSRGLPYLVAATPNQDIAGFANAHPFRGGAGAYAATAELTIFCDPAFVGRGLGGQLLSAIVAVLKERGGPNAELILEQHRGTDPQIAQLLAVMSFDPDRGTKLKQFYEKNGFTLVREAPPRVALCVALWITDARVKKVGRLRKVGCKFGKWIDTMYLQMSLDGEPIA